MGTVLARQLEPEAARHGRQQLDDSRPGQDLLDQLEVGEVVLDVQDAHGRRRPAASRVADLGAADARRGWWRWPEARR